MGVVLNSLEGACILPTMCPPRVVIDPRNDEIPSQGTARRLGAAYDRRRDRVLTTIMLTDIVDSTVARPT